MLCHPCEGGHGPLCLPAPEAAGLQRFILQAPASCQLSMQGWTFLLKSCSLLFFIRVKNDAVRLMIAGQEQVAAGRQKEHSIRKGSVMEPSIGLGCSLPESGSAGEPGLILFA